MSGDLQAARDHRTQALHEAATLDDPAVLAEVIGAFDVPAIWTTNDDPAHSAELAKFTERTLAAFPGRTPERARLLATLAVERRGIQDSLAEASEAESIARELGDPTLLAFALNARFLHTCHRTGLAPERAAIGRDLVALAEANNLVTYEVLGHLILVQAHSALAEFGAADHHATAADALGRRYDLPLVSVFTDWYAALKRAAHGHRAEAEAAYRAAAARLSGTGMWGVEQGLLPLALLSLDPSTVDLTADWGPYLPWVRALVEPETPPDGPADLMSEVRACLLAITALRRDDKALLQRAYDLLLPARAELAGAGTGLLTFGPVREYLERLEHALGS